MKRCLTLLVALLLGACATPPRDDNTLTGEALYRCAQLAIALDHARIHIDVRREALNRMRADVEKLYAQQDAEAKTLGRSNLASVTMFNTRGTFNQRAADEVNARAKRLSAYAVRFNLRNEQFNDSCGNRRYTEFDLGKLPKRLSSVMYARARLVTE